MNSREITTEVARLWRQHKEENTEVFQKYTRMYTEDRERFNANLNDVEENVPGDLVENKVENENVAEIVVEVKNDHKKPVNAYVLYSRDIRASVKNDNPEMDHRKIAREISRLWREHKDNNTEVYQRYSVMYADSRAKYDANQQENDVE